MKPSAVHRRALSTLFDRVGITPFRRSDLSEVLYPNTRPRSRVTADHLADAVLREAARAGAIQRHGHLHWTKTSSERRLLSGRRVAELAEVCELSLSTRCPGKWVAADLETGEIWIGTPTGWQRAPAEVTMEAAACAAASSKAN
ncbi:hypothetical protein [Variovorax gossypii]